MERKTYLNRYRLCLDRIGIPVVIRRSADEATLQADDLESDAQVAVQLVPTEALGPQEREQLEAEARSAQQLNHINIPILRDFGFDHDHLLYVTEQIEGTTAEDWIKTKGPLPASAVVQVASQVVSALAAARSRGISHHAVHPGNIMFVAGKTANGEWPLIKVLNLVGLAPTLPPPGTNGTAFLNPADFASPEQLTNGMVDFRSEVYSLGCTLWFLLKGRPLAGGAAAVQNAEGLSAPVRQLLTKMLAGNPEDRPSNPKAAQLQIEDCVAAMERKDVIASEVPLAKIPAARAPSKGEIEPLPQRITPWKPVALAALFLAIATLAFVVLKQWTNQNLAGEVSPTTPPAPAVASVTPPENPYPSPTKETKEAPIFAANVALPEDKSEPSTSEITAPVEPALLAQVPPADAAAPTPRIEMMASVPLEPEGTPQPAPVMATNSSSPDPGIAMMETALVQSAATTEAPPPAEGPIESEKPSADISEPPPIPTTEEEPLKGILIKTPQLASNKISTSRSAATKAAKKKPIAAKSPPQRPSAYSQPRHQPPGTSVGHILFPVVPAQHADSAAPTPTPHRKKHR